MSAGRPANIVPIAGNYPAGGNAWSSTAKRVPGAGYLTPKTSASPQEVNDLIGANQDTLLALITMCGQNAALNWPAQSTDVYVGGSAPNANGLAWDPRYGRWLVYGIKSGTTNAFLAYASKDGGRTWFSFGGQNPSSGAADGSLVGVIFNPGTGRCAVASWKGASGTMDPSALTDEESRLNVLTVSGKVAGIAYGGLYIFLGRQSTTTPLLLTSPLGSSGVWTTRAPAFAAPSTWCSASDYALAASGAMVMGIELGVSNYGEYVTSPDGLTWTLRSHPITSGWANTGLCWASDRWILSQSNGTDSRILYSSDGIAWTTLTPATLTGVFLGGAASIGALIFAAGYTHFDIHGMWSTDGGATWQIGGQYSMTLASGGTPDRGYSNGSQFATLSINRAGFSNYMCIPGVQGF